MLESSDINTIEEEPLHAQMATHATHLVDKGVQRLRQLALADERQACLEVTPHQLLNLPLVQRLRAHPRSQQRQCVASVLVLGLRMAQLARQLLNSPAQPSDAPE